MLTVSLRGRSLASSTSNMAQDNFSTASLLLRGITDEIAFGERHPVQQEGIPELINRVRETSKRASAHMRCALAAAYPPIGWNDSEDKHASDAGSSRYWVYDAIDGAYHYLQGLPLWSSSLVLVDNAQAVMALVYDPHQRELFVAQAGKFAAVNGKPIQTSRKTNLSTAVVGSALPPFASVTPEEHAHALGIFSNVSRNVFVMRQMAAASLQLAYVAAGRLYSLPGTSIVPFRAVCRRFYLAPPSYGARQRSAREYPLGSDKVGGSRKGIPTPG
jgi:myo-inositol-1(or 4)-monophosphatase